jgi:uncharacterized protein
LDKITILKYLTNYKKQNSEKYGITSLGLFGSATREEFNEESDIDIFIILKKPDLITLSRIRIELEEILKFHVDLIHYRERMNKYLKDKIDLEKIYA